MSYQVIQGDCLEVLPSIPSGSVDVLLTDPPYPEIDRDYGRLTEAAWWDLMMGVCRETRRILKPSGSAVFILQPNSAKVGSMRGWLWRFMHWVTTDWNMVQDAYWWNFNALPVGGAITGGLMRGSVKPCIWAGSKDCYRNQGAVLWQESQANIDKRTKGMVGMEVAPSGRHVNRAGIIGAAARRGGVTPFNLFPVSNGDSSGSSGAYGHGAGTPLKLADWWTRYLVPAGGVVLDPFNGAGTMGIAALQNGASYIGIEKMPKYVDVSLQRLAKVQPSLIPEGLPHAG
jgi:DNA modification methylase